MSSTISKAKKHRASRNKNNETNRPQPTTPIGITSIAAALTVLTITFDQVIALNGLPNYTTDVAGAVPVSAALTSPTTLQVTFDADLTLATAVNVPYEEPSVRNASGGFVAPSAISI